MKKLFLYVFLGLLVCSNVNAGLDSKDKFIFYGCYEGNDKSTLDFLRVGNSQTCSQSGNIFCRKCFISDIFGRLETENLQNEGNSTDLLGFACICFDFLRFAWMHFCICMNLLGFNASESF